MNIGITSMAANLGMSFENIILLIVFSIGLVFYAKDFKIGLIWQAFTAMLLFIWFYDQGMNYAPSIVVFFMTLVILAISLYAVEKASSRGVVI